jgi:Leucine-rich repeat (LRR) protein
MYIEKEKVHAVPLRLIMSFSRSPVSVHMCVCVCVCLCELVLYHSFPALLFCLSFLDWLHVYEEHAGADTPPAAMLLNHRIHHHNEPYVTGPRNLSLAWYAAFLESCGSQPQLDTTDYDEEVIAEASVLSPLPMQGGPLATICAFFGYASPLAFAAVSPLARVCSELRNTVTGSAASTLLIRSHCLIHALRPSAIDPTAYLALARLTAWWRRKFNFPFALYGDSLSGEVSLTDSAFDDLLSLHLPADATAVTASERVLASLQELSAHSNGSSLTALLGRAGMLRSLQGLTLHGFTEEDFRFAAQLPALTGLALYGGEMEVLDMRQFTAAATLESLDVESDELADLEGLEQCVSLKAFTLAGCSSLTSLSAVAALTSLRVLDASGCEAADITGLAKCHLLEELRLASCPGLADLTPLRGLMHLRELDISDGDVRSVSELSNCAALEVLDISYCLDVSDIACLSHLLSLKELRANHSGVRDMGSQGKWHALQVIDVADCKELHSLAGLGGAPRLKIIKASCSVVEDISGLARCTRLETVNFIRCVCLTSLAPLAGAPQLRVIDAGESSVSDVSGLGRCPELRKVDFLHCTSLYDISPLAGAPKLEQIFACESSVRCIDGLNRCPSLTVVDFECCETLENLTPLAGAPRLHTIIASHSGVQTIAGLCTCPALRTVDLFLCHNLREDAVTEFDGTSVHLQVVSDTFV